MGPNSNNIISIIGTYIIAYRKRIFIYPGPTIVRYPLWDRKHDDPLNPRLIIVESTKRASTITFWDHILKVFAGPIQNFQ